MALHIELCSFLRKYVSDYDPAKGIELGISEGVRVEQAIRQLDIPFEEVKIIVVNHKAVKPDHLLKEGDRVGLFTVVTGG
jgi:sulfur carrier protein ThiS